MEVAPGVGVEVETVGTPTPTAGNSIGESTAADNVTASAAVVPSAALVSEVSIWQLLAQHPEICVLGLSQACFEGAVYSFGK